MSDGALLADFPDPVVPNTGSGNSSAMSSNATANANSSSIKEESKTPKPRKVKTPEQMAQMRAKKKENADRLKREKEEKLERDIEERIRREMEAKGFQASVPTKPLPPAPMQQPIHQSIPYARKPILSKTPLPSKRPNVRTHVEAGPGFDPRTARPPNDIRTLYNQQLPQYGQGYDDRSDTDYDERDRDYMYEDTNAQYQHFQRQDPDPYYVYPDPPQPKAPVQGAGPMIDRSSRFSVDLNQLQYV